MNSRIKICLTITLYIFFLFGQVHAQKTSLPNLLIGDWIMHGPSSPQINDTITLTKELLNKTNAPKWTFKESKKLIITHYFKIISDYNKILKLICAK
jgi:hypothetical protein